MNNRRFWNVGKHFKMVTDWPVEEVYIQVDCKAFMEVQRKTKPVVNYSLNIVLTVLRCKHIACDRNSLLQR